MSTEFQRSSRTNHIALKCDFICREYNFLPNDPAYGWDGNYRGKPLNPGVFAWFAEVEYIDGFVEIIKGDVTLVR